MGENKIQLFENKRIRTVWDEEEEQWLFSIVDVVGVLTEQPTQRGATFYWGKLKQRLKEEGSELLTKCQQLKMTAADGKKRLTDVAKRGGGVAGVARQAVEAQTGKSVITSKKRS